MNPGQIYKHFKGGRYLILFPKAKSTIRKFLENKKYSISIGLKAKVEETMEEKEIYLYQNEIYIPANLEEKFNQFEDKKFIIYCSLQTGGIFIRTEENFLEQVEKPELNYSGPRFVPEENIAKNQILR